ncbi:MAG: cation:proton antiporter [Elusimicrobiales bacterium]|nr:cation:proton antiporter [Elusimicrobiales bacterium]
MEISILATFTIGIAASLILGIAANRLKVSPIIGYLLAGIILGFFSGVRENKEVISQFADIGVILLMFGIGLKFHLTELIAVWKAAVPGAVIQSTLSTLITAALLHLLGWPWHSGIILGMAISVASTVVMARVLSDTRDIHTQVGHIAIGWTVVEDIMTVMILLALPMIFSGSQHSSAWEIFGIAIGKIAALTLTVIVLGKWVLPQALKLIAETKSAELFTLAVLALALGIADGSSVIFGVSIELGAFLAGLAVGRSDFAARAAGEAIPMRDAFSVLFFVSVGMMFDFKELISNPWITLVIMTVVIIIKPIVALATVRLLGKPLGISINIGAAFSQIGEFSFILGTVAYSIKHPGTGLPLISEAAFNALIATSIISIALNPFIYAKARKIKISDGKDLMPKKDELLPENKNRCIIIGFGPVGKAMYGRIKQRKDAEIRIIELNYKTVQSLKEANIDAIYGDALRPGILEQAGIIGAGFLALTTQVEDGIEIVKRAKQLNPEIKVLVRRDLFLGASKYNMAGADIVAIGEGEVSEKMAREIGRLIDETDRLAQAAKA